MAMALCLLVAAVALVFGVPAGLVVLGAALWLNGNLEHGSWTMWELNQFEIVLGVVAGVVLLAGIVLAARACVRMEACSEQEEYYKALRWRELKRMERKRKRRTVGFLISDHSLALATRIAALVGVDPSTEAEAFTLLCDTCKEALAGYERKAARLHNRLDPLEDELSPSWTPEN